MEREKVLGLFGSKVRTGTGFKNLMGNFNPSVGDYIYTDNGYVFGHESVQGRLPIVTGTNRANGYGFWLCLAQVECLIYLMTYTIETDIGNYSVQKMKYSPTLKNCHNSYFEIQDNKIIKINDEAIEDDETEDWVSFEYFRGVKGRVFDGRNKYTFSRDGKELKELLYDPYPGVSYVYDHQKIFNTVKMDGCLQHSETKNNANALVIYACTFNQEMYYLIYFDEEKATSEHRTVHINKNNEVTIQKYECSDSDYIYNTFYKFFSKNIIENDDNIIVELINKKRYKFDIYGNLYLLEKDNEFFINVADIYSDEIIKNFKIIYENSNSSDRIKYPSYYNDEDFKKIIGFSFYERFSDEQLSKSELKTKFIENILKSLIIINVNDNKFVFSIKNEMYGFPLFLMNTKKENDKYITTVLDVYITGKDGAFLTFNSETVKL